MSLILEAYAIHDGPQPLAPAPAERDWMEEFAGRHAYRCLPVSIGNTYGWQLLLPVDVTAEWNGGPAASDVPDDIHGASYLDNRSYCFLPV